MESNMRASKTYKLKSGTIEQAIYFTVVDGESCVEAMFINSKEMHSFQFITALMTSYSRQIKSGIPISEIIEDMKETFDPSGSYHVQGRECAGGGQLVVNSLVHHLGIILEEHVANGS